MREGRGGGGIRDGVKKGLEKKGKKKKKNQAGQGYGRVRYGGLEGEGLGGMGRCKVGWSGIGKDGGRKMMCLQGWGRTRQERQGDGKVWEEWKSLRQDGKANEGIGRKGRSGDDLG